jgi:hypothetical protein
MATKGKRSDEGGSTEETKGRVPAPDEEALGAAGPHGDAEIEVDLEDLEEVELAAGGRHDAEHALGHGGAGRREEIASNPDNEEELAEDALRSSEEPEDEAGHGRGRRG